MRATTPFALPPDAAAHAAPAAAFGDAGMLLAALLALQMLGAAALLYMASRRMADRAGITSWSAGLALYGLAQAARLAGGDRGFAAAALAADTTLIAGLLLIGQGLLAADGRTPPRAPLLLAAVAAFALLHAALPWFAPAQDVWRIATGGIAGALGLALAAVSMRANRGRGGDARILRLAPAAALALGGGWALWQALGAMRPGGAAGLGAAAGGAAGPLDALLTSAFSLLLALALLGAMFARQARQFTELSSRDALTRMLNGNGLDDVLRRHFGARDAAPLTLLHVNVDHLERINRKHSHEAGDAVLRAIAAILADHVRGNDFVARTGGEEFLVGCVGTSAAAALALGERLRHGVAAMRVPWPGAISPLRCTVSIGVSESFAERSHWVHAARQAERALFIAKASGRDRVISITGIET